VLTVNDRVVLTRRRWYAPGLGSCTPLDAFLDAAEATVSLGVREWAFRLNQGARSFAKAAANLARTAQVDLSEELLRQVVEGEGQAVVAVQRAGRLTISWTAADFPIPDAQGGTKCGDPSLPGQRWRQGPVGDPGRETHPADQGQTAAPPARSAVPAVAPGRARGRPALSGVQARHLLRSNAGAPAHGGHAGQPRGGRPVDAPRHRPHPIGPSRR
jgi:hypothetical protein